MFWGDLGRFCYSNVESDGLDSAGRQQMVEWIAVALPHGANVGAMPEWPKGAPC